MGEAEGLGRPGPGKDLAGAQLRGCPNKRTAERRGTGLVPAPGLKAQLNGQGWCCP